MRCQGPGWGRSKHPWHHSAHRASRQGGPERLTESRKAMTSVHPAQPRECPTCPFAETRAESGLQSGPRQGRPSHRPLGSMATIHSVTTRTSHGSHCTPNSKATPSSTALPPRVATWGRSLCPYRPCPRAPSWPPQPCQRPLLWVAQATPGDGQGQGQQEEGTRGKHVPTAHSCPWQYLRAASETRGQCALLIRGGGCGPG